MSGLPYWTMDIGGFVVPNKFEKPNAEDLEEWRELNTRWYQFGAFVPLFRVAWAISLPRNIQYCSRRSSGLQKFALL